MTPEILLGQLDALVGEVEELQARSRHHDCSDVMSETRAVEIATRAYAAIGRIAGRATPYLVRAEEIRGEKTYEQKKVLRVVGVLRSLRADLNAGYLRSVEELIHGELFGDFLEMARHLCESGYKDAAAVVAGSALEAHLRQLAKRFAVSTEQSTKRGSEPKKADLLNADLVKSGVYQALDQKNVTAWLGLRNNAAHGQYGEYEKAQVSLMIDSIRDFISRHPA